MNDEMANRIAQGVISGVILTVIISLLFYFLKRREKKEGNVAGVNNPTNSSLIQSYFFQSVSNKGIRRLIVVGSLLLPLLISTAIWFTDARVVENDYGETFRYYNGTPFLVLFILSFIAYWAMYMIVVWIYKGFEESKREKR